MSQRLVDIDVLLSFGCLDDRLGVSVIRRRDDEPLHVRVGKQFFIALGGPATILLRECVAALFRAAEAVDEAEPIAALDRIGKNFRPSSETDGCYAHRITCHIYSTP